jgi:hypothetical protein
VSSALLFHLFLEAVASILRRPLMALLRDVIPIADQIVAKEAADNATAATDEARAAASRAVASGTTEARKRLFAAINAGLLDPRIPESEATDPTTGKIWRGVPGADAPEVRTPPTVADVTVADDQLPTVAQAPAPEPEPTPEPTVAPAAG